MIQDDTFSYLKANTVLFAQKMCEALGDMCGAQFSPLKETIREGAYSSPFSVMMFTHFTGTIQGYYILSFNEEVALKLIGAWNDDLSHDAIRDFREDFSGILKETLNLAVGQAIEELEKSFTDLTITPSTVVYGEIEFPDIMSGSMHIEGREGKILCGFSLNLASLKIGEKLEETLRDLKTQTAQAKESRRTIESILAILPAGLLAIDADGIIQPGYSDATASVVGNADTTDVAGSFLPEFIGAPDGDHAAWKNWFRLSYDKFNELPFSDIRKLCPVGEFTNRSGRILKLGWHPIADDIEGRLDKILVVIEDVTRQRELERQMAESIGHKAFDPGTVMVPLYEHEIDAAAALLTPIIDTCATDRTFGELRPGLERIRNAILDLRATALSFFAASFSAFVENACRKTGKMANVAVSHDVKIDIGLMRELHHCLIHLINNAVEHGIEFPEERIRSGKAEVGMITIAGSCERDVLRIRIEDDGKGIDCEEIRSRLQRNYHYSPAETAAMNDGDLYPFLLKPGFSAKAEPTEISGRGAGMDVVNFTVSHLGGSISVYSTKGKGTAVELIIPRN